MRFKISILTSDLCDYTFRTVSNTDINKKDAAFKNNAPFRLCITNQQRIHRQCMEDIDIVTPRYNLLEYSDNYSMTSGSLWNYYRNEIDGVNDNILDSKSFEYKTKIIGKTPARPPQSAQPPPSPNETQPSRTQQPSILPLNTETTVPLKYLSNFWRSLNFSLINCEMELDLRWSRYCILLEDDDNITVANFMITSATFYVPLINLSTIDKKDLKEHFLGINTYLK